MAIEIERKFLVNGNEYKNMASSSVEMAQYYLQDAPERTVRVRVAGESAWLTIKGKSEGCSRNEWEYPIPAADAREMIAICGGHGLEKRRWLVPYGGHTWEVDEYGGRHAGLVVAEIELPSEDVTFDMPPFVGEEVTGRPEYYNSVLAKF